MTTTEAKALLEKIDEIKETEAPMPHVYRQGWQDACSRIAEEIAALHHADRGGDGQLREVASATEVTAEAKAVEAALEIARHVARGYRPKLAEADRMAETLLALSARVERLKEALQEIGDWAGAFPVAVFPEPDFKRAHEVLAAAGISLDAISAANMRHVITQVQEIVERALRGPGGGAVSRMIADYALRAPYPSRPARKG